MKRLFLILLIFVSLDVVAQNDYFKIKEGSFTHVVGAVMDDAKEHTDVDNKPMALFKISTENINDEERHKLYFTGNRVTEISDKVYKTGSVWIYVTAEHSDFLEIRHPDYGVTRFYFPESLCDFCTYEMVLQYIPVESTTIQKSRNNFLIINVDQQDAAIFVDNNYVGNGSVEVPLQIGMEHTYKIECDLYYEESGKIMMTAGDPIEKTISLRPAHGFINVNTEPEQGAMVYIDGKKVGTSPYKSDKLASGTYKVKALMTMYNPVEQTVTVTDGNTIQAILNMSANFVNVAVNTDADADIYIDEEFKAKGTWSGRLSEGTHFFEARKDKHRTKSKNVNLVLGKDEIINMGSPEPIYGFLELRSNPTKADIYIDGKHIGQTPRAINDLLIGKHELKLMKQGCASMTKTITIEENETLALNETLQTGKEIVIKTDRSDDKVYVDGDYVGTTPVTTNVSFGKHELKATRGSQTTTKDIEVTISSNRQEYMLAFGKIITINSSSKGDKIYVDGKKVGETPMNIDLSLGKHEVEVRRGRSSDTKVFYVGNNGTSSYSFAPQKTSFISKISLPKNLLGDYNSISLIGGFGAPNTDVYGTDVDFYYPIGLSLNGTYSFVNKELGMGWFFDGMFFGKSTSIIGGVTIGSLTDYMGYLSLKIGGGFGNSVIPFENYNYYDYSTPAGYIRRSGYVFLVGFYGFEGLFTCSFDIVFTTYNVFELRMGIGINWN